jgi:aryl-alcohol dehydrogenase-like predicted oxidoreductase
LGCHCAILVFAIRGLRIYDEVMNYRTLGRPGLKVSELCLGTMTFGENFYGIAVVDQPSSNAMVARALAAGINFCDTADVYSYGESETVNSGQ